MRPALQRLLARPSSLEFLKLLIGRPVVNGPIEQHKGKRRASGLALAVDTHCHDVEDVTVNENQRAISSKVKATTRRRSEIISRKAVIESKDRQQGLQVWSPITKQVRAPASIASPAHMLHQPETFSEWPAKLWSRQRLEFESDMASPDPARLLNQQSYKLDLELWLYLLDYRQKQHGDVGTRMFWEAIFSQGIRLPTRGESANTLWYTLLDLKFEHLAPELLENICSYADQLFEIHNAKWPELYVHILQHFLVIGSHTDAIKWHYRLQRYHGTGKRDFLKLCYEVIQQKGNTKALMEIYANSGHRKCYDKIIPRFCAQEDFQAAVEWHFLFLQRGDLPSSLSVVEPLLKHLAIFGPKSAVRLAQSLRDVGLSFVSAIPVETTRITPKMSIDIVSEVHSKTFHVSEKPYNDSLGARWLATSWVTLDTAIKTIHALSVQEIGPLSLQSIALREPDAASIAARIQQLKDLGITIGTSRYALAVSRFATSNKKDLLNLLLQSDQHPSELDNEKLQEKLLAHFAKTKQWKQFRLVLEVLSLRSDAPQVQKRNLIFRISMETGESISVDTIRENIRDMIHDDIPIKHDTIMAIKQAVLQPRKRGHRPISQGKITPAGQVDNCISLLRQILEGGHYVRIHFWREMIRRLGMMNHFHALEDLCIKIATWYAPNSLQLRLARVPLQVTTNNLEHPLRQLFNETLQMAIVEWGFIHALSGKRDAHSAGSSASSITSGIRVLKKLSDRGVWISNESVRKAVLNRMVIYYGPGESNRPYNRAAQERLHLSLQEMALLVDRELGVPHFSGVDIEKVVDAHGIARMHSRKKVGWKRDAKGMLRSGVYEEIM